MSDLDYIPTQMPRNPDFIDEFLVGMGNLSTS